MGRSTACRGTDGQTDGHSMYFPRRLYAVRGWDVTHINIKTSFPILISCLPVLLRRVSSFISLIFAAMWISFLILSFIILRKCLISAMTPLL